jgi:hypothetical protein
VNQIDELAIHAVTSPVADPPTIEELLERVGARVHRRRVRRLGVVGCLAAVAMLVIAGLTMTRHDGPAVSIAPTAGKTTVSTPPIGKTRATALADGTPVWIVRHNDGTVSAVSAISTHAPHGLKQLVGWCAAGRNFEDGMYGSTWDEGGDKIGGPAPTGLPLAPVDRRPRGQIEIGTPEGSGSDQVSRAASAGFIPCFSNTPVGFDPGTTRLPHYFESDPTSADAIARQANRRIATSVEWIPDAALVVTPDNTVRLCTAKSSLSETVCTDGPPVTGVDAEGLREQLPAAYQVITGALLVRVLNGTVEPVAFTRGYTTSTFSPSS